MSDAPVLVLLINTAQQEVECYVVPPEVIAAHPTLGTAPIDTLRLAHGVVLSESCPEVVPVEKQEAVRRVWQMTTFRCGWPDETEWTGILRSYLHPCAAPPHDMILSAFFIVVRRS